MPSKIYSAAIVGLEAKIIEIETEISSGLRYFVMVGLPGKEVEEAKERIGAALKSAGFSSPHSHSQRIIVNLAPADIKKEGALYDLPIALGYLSASRQIAFDAKEKLFAGELGLNGDLKPIKGTLALALTAREKGFKEIIIPLENAQEAALVKKIKVIPAKHLGEVIDYLRGEKIFPRIEPDKKPLEKEGGFFSIAWVKGHNCAKRALEISAAGKHHLLFFGPPGTGKTLLAKSIRSILPPLSFSEILETTKIYSIAGLLEKKPFIAQPPFRSPHHSSSEASLIGGGNPPRPGEITLAHNGVLFLDELAEFHRDVLESLRQPIEEGRISILRAKYNLSLPAKFTLLAASNPCPCGFYNDPEKICTCTASQRQKYQRKLSGPLMDRIDLFVSVPQLKYEKLVEEEQREKTEEAKIRIKKARDVQRERFKKERIRVNSEMGILQLKKYCELPPVSNAMARKMVNSGQLSPRGYHRVLKTSRTIADLDGEEKITDTNFQEAIMYRQREDSRQMLK